MSKRLRMLVALATVAAMMLSLAGIASAQFSDVDEDASYADAVELLADLKIAQGYPDGSFGVDNPMTRQEFAVFVVRAMGREALANSFANFQTSFSDDAQIGAWARGHVYLATNSRIINGYPDGTFRPNGHVTQAEALTMLVRALGFGDYADKLGTWPTGYLLAADELGLTDGLNVVSGLPMTRSEMAIALKNALVVSKTLDDGKLTDVANGEASWLRKAHKYTASQYREVAGDTSKVAGVFERFRAGERVELEDGRIYNLADEPEMSFNNGDPAPLEKDDIERGDRVTLHLNPDDEVTEIAVFRYDVEGVLTGVSLQSGEEEYGSINAQGHASPIEVDADTKIFVDGKAVILADLDEEDVVNEAFVRVATEDEAGEYAVEIQVYTNTVKGKVERVGRDSGGRYVIIDVDGDDEKYYYSNNVAPNVGDTATFILDDEDMIVAAVLSTPASQEYFAIAVSQSSNSIIFERADGSEVDVPTSGDNAWTLPGGRVTIGNVYRINEENTEVKEVGAAAYTGELLTIASTYIRVNDNGAKRITLADDVIVEIDGNPFKSVSDLRTGRTVEVYVVEVEGVDIAEYIKVLP